MNTNDILSIRKICETRSIAKAASQLFMTPQALSVVVKRVENELGVNLFDRVPAGMNMNEYGKIFFERSDSLIRELSEISELFHLDINNKHGVLRIAFSQGIIVMMDIGYILDFTKLFPNFRLEIIEGSDKKVEELVHTNKADLGITSAPTFSNNFDCFPWCKFRCCAVINKNRKSDNERVYKDTISVKELKNVPIVLENKDFSMHRDFKKICKETYKFDPYIYFETIEIDNALAIAADGYATAIVPLPIVESSQYDNLHAMPISENLFWRWCIIKNKRESISEIEQVFLNHLFEKSKEKGWFS